MQHVGLAVAGNQVQTAGDAHRFFIEVDGENLVCDVILAALRLVFHGKQVGNRQALGFEYLFPDMEDGVYGEARRAARRVDDGFRLLRVHHLDAHVDDPARCEVLAFFALRGFIDEVFEGFVYHVQIGVEELPFFERADADLQMLGTKLDLVVVLEDAAPLLLGVVEQALDIGLELSGGVAVTEAQVFVATPEAIHFVVELGEDQLEDFLEGVDAGIGENLVLHVLDQLLEAARALAFSHALVFDVDQDVDCPRLASNVVDGLRDLGQVGDFDEIVGVFAVPDDGERTIAPQGKWRAFGVGVGAQLFFAILELGSFDFDDDVGRVGVVGIHDHDVGTLGGVATEGDRVFDLDSAEWIAVAFSKFEQPELADDFLRLGEPVFAGGNAFQRRFAVFFEEAGFQSVEMGASELSEAVADVGVFENGAEVVHVEVVSPDMKWLHIFQSE